MWPHSIYRILFLWPGEVEHALTNRGLLYLIASRKWLLRSCSCVEMNSFRFLSGVHLSLFEAWQRRLSILQRSEAIFPSRLGVNSSQFSSRLGPISHSISFLFWYTRNKETNGPSPLSYLNVQTRARYFFPDAGD